MGITRSLAGSGDLGMPLLSINWRLAEIFEFGAAAGTDVLGITDRLASGGDISASGSWASMV